LTLVPLVTTRDLGLTSGDDVGRWAYINRDLSSRTRDSEKGGRFGFLV